MYNTVFKNGGKIREEHQCAAATMYVDNNNHKIVVIWMLVSLISTEVKEV